MADPALRLRRKAEVEYTYECERKFAGIGKDRKVERCRIREEEKLVIVTMTENTQLCYCPVD